MVNQFWGHWARRGLRAAAASALVLLAACGSSSKYDEFIPTRIVSVGDQLSYLGNGYDRYTVNNVVGGTIENNWVLKLASLYRLTPTDVVSKATATSNLVANLTDQMAQVDLVATPSPGDMLVINAGMSDIIYWTDEVLRAGTSTTPAAAKEKVRLAGVALQQFALSQQSKYSHIFIVSAYNLKNSPYVQNATTTTAIDSYGGLVKLVDDMTSVFNNAVKSSGTDELLTFPSGSGIRLLEIDGTLLTADYTNIGVTTAGLRLGACDATISGGGCTTATADPSYAQYFFADDKFPSPAVHAYIGSLAYAFLRGGKGW